MMDLRRKQLKKYGIETLEETAVTRILRGKNGEVVGVVAFHYASGEIYTIRAKAVVVATGPADRLSARATGSREQSGDGLAISYRAGVELMNLEIQWWHASDFKWPPTWQRMHILPNPLVGTTETARMYNSDGDLFFDQSTDAPISYAPYPTQIKKLMEQINAGKARGDGGYHTGYDHIDPDVLRRYARALKAFEKVGLPPERARVECAPSWHYRQGGINANPETLETKTSGLMVAGGVSGHHNGTLALVTYDGYLCAEVLKDREISRQPLGELNRGEVESEVERIQGLRRELPSGGVTPMTVKRQIRDLMHDKMNIVKTEQGMTEALNEIVRIRSEDVPRMGLSNLTTRMNYGWIDALDVFNLLDVAELTIRSSLNRKESRGPFYRNDYPHTDNSSWHVKNIVYKDDSGEDRFRLENYENIYLPPEFAREDYFKVAW